ncbi:MAG: FAD-dependent oxidoreductase [Burkholderiaceae bacterium]|nr:FAD-dependent oxidoreductase [Burkholderiaceae bacterium]
MKRVVLIGAGHAHAQVLKDWITDRPAGAELWVVSPHALAPYSGMVPGWLAGYYRYEDICIDFAALAAAAGAHWVRDELVELDPEQRRLTLASRRVLDYDLLSLNVGSTLRPPPSTPAPLLALRPLGELHLRWVPTLATLSRIAAVRPVTITAIGGGAAGFEALLAVRHRILQIQPRSTVHVTLVSAGVDLLPGLAPGAIEYGRRTLASLDATVELGKRYDDAQRADSDLLLWATGAEAHDWQRASGLAVSEPGWIRIDRRLCSISHPEVYATGDCAAWAQPLPKAGVFAVRMGPVLSRNLQAAVSGQTPAAYTPQRRVLSLLATGNRRAIASWGPWSAEGAWVWRWKDRIDRRFLKRFERPPFAAP